MKQCGMVMKEGGDRLYFMDSMRGVLMTLGIVLHSAQIFNPMQSWIIFSNNTNEAANFIVKAIHLFRMPAFFVISGFFCVLTLMKYSPSIFFKIRMSRILIPLFFTALTLNSLQMIILTHTGWRSFDLEDYITDGQYISHLWFLVNLVVYFCAAALLSLLPSHIKLLTNEVINYFSKIPMFVIIFLLPIISIAIHSLNKLGFPLYSSFLNVFNMFSILSYLPYFVFGGILGSRRDLLIKFSTIKPIFSVVLFLLAILATKACSFNNNLVAKIAIAYFDNLTVWLSVIICFFVFHCFFNKESRGWAFMSDASYTVYLFHHVFVIAIGLLLIKIDAPAFIGMGIAIGTSLAITIFIHKYFVLKIKILRYMFNGK